ncbi:hypothetical protein K7640_10830 [Micromonospora sp. PLK6-60]|uniref:hypothetical protein n=1 Tax=Micromonospora sp. PLK6-60 TaxID=2873383 RepID=UPI001CA71A20|nr:hypothetical protein [Micromonospora sp. PLK6-60]MBY8872333.1 hypothetical protein [Micromonospora sp. PLK6-60]
MDKSLGTVPEWLKRDNLVLEALWKWAAGKGSVIEVLPQGNPLHGYTGAYLFTVRRESPTGPGRTEDSKMLVKVHPPGGKGQPESGRHIQAKADAPGFAARHMVEEHHGWHPVGDGRHLSFQDVANGGDPVVTMDEIEDDGDLVDVYRTVITAFLTDWNQGPPSTAPTTVCEYVRRELAARSELAAVRAAVRDLGQSDPYSDWLEIDGAPLPNPLRLAEPDGPFGESHLRYIHGFSHGDPHGGNLLIAKTAEGVLHPNTFTLIDFESYEHEAPVSRDPVVLLISTVLRWVAPQAASDGRPPHGLPSDQADALLTQLIRPDQTAPTRLLRVLAGLVRLTHEAGLAYATPGNWRPEWRRQYRLSLIATALTATTFDNLGPEARRWCLRLAAHATEAYRREDYRQEVAAPKAISTDTPRPRPVDQSWPLNNALTYDMPPGQRHEPVAPGRHRAAAGPRNAAPAGIEPDQAGRPVHRNNRRELAGGPAAGMRHPQTGPLAGRPTGVAGKRRLPIRLVVFLALGSSLAAYLTSDGGSGRDFRPPVTVPPPSRDQTPPSRDNSRDPVPPMLVDPSVKLSQIADRVARLSERPIRGRYAFTCLRVWSPPGSDDLMRYREEWRWWTREQSGRHTVIDVADGQRAKDQDTWYDRDELTDVPPNPSEELATLRKQMAEQLAGKPPALRNAAGTLETVAWIYRYRPLTASQRATLLRLLGSTDGIVHQGKSPDRAGRYGYAISADNGAGQRDTLLFDEKTGRLLSHTKTSANDKVLGYYLFLASYRTDTITDEACGDPATVNSGG